MSTRNSEQHLIQNGEGRRIESKQRVEAARLQLWLVEDVTYERSPVPHP